MQEYAPIWLLYDIGQGVVLSELEVLGDALFACKKGFHFAPFILYTCAKPDTYENSVDSEV